MLRLLRKVAYYYSCVYSLQVLNCQESTIYVLAPLRYAIVYGCSDATIVLGAVGKVNSIHVLLRPLALFLPMMSFSIAVASLSASKLTFTFLFVLKAVRIEHCERVHVIVAAKHICIASCRECVFFLGVNQRPLMVGDNHKLQVSMFTLFLLFIHSTFWDSDFMTIP